jgi:tRNA-splicing ligase RtcB
MPDVHFGIGATVGSVVPTVGAIVPAAVGVDIGCGMMAVQTSLSSKDLPDDLAPMRAQIERAVPHGLTKRGRDKGSWDSTPARADEAWGELLPVFERITQKHRASSRRISAPRHAGTGNHFIEICQMKRNAWFHASGSRGVGSFIGRYFIELAKKTCAVTSATCEPGPRFSGRLGALRRLRRSGQWAQRFAMQNRVLMMQPCRRRDATKGVPPFKTHLVAVSCHHNYVARERHCSADVFLTQRAQ